MRYHLSHEDISRCCCLQRPLDDQTQPRIRVETEAVLAVLSEMQAGSVALLSSDALEYEVNRIPNEHRRTEVLAVLALASERLEISEPVGVLAKSLESKGIAPMDAIHLSLAATASAVYFSTTDDKLLKKAASIGTLSCEVISLLNIVSEVIK